MSKKTNYIEILRSPKPADAVEYVRWLERRFEAMSRLRLLEMSDYVDRVVVMQDRYSSLIRKGWESDGSYVEPTKKGKKEVSQGNKRSTKGYVYILRVVEHDNLYKIGRTKNPDNRLKTFSVKLPFSVEYEFVIKTDDMYKLERDLHYQYRDKRQRGSEFFILTDADISAIKQFDNKAS